MFEHSKNASSHSQHLTELVLTKSLRLVIGRLADTQRLTYRHTAKQTFPQKQRHRERDSPTE